MTREQLRNFYSHGSPDPLPERIPLRAGPLSMYLEAGDLRYIRLGDREVLRRIYAAVRDRNWDTVPGVVSELQQDIAADRFNIRYRCEHLRGGIHFVWDAEIIGEGDGSIRFTFDGEAKSTFLRNRIGFCVLHPIGCAGAKCRAIYADGSQKESVFPKIIAAEQPVTALHDLVGLDHEVQTGVWAELRFEGDLFETEDQRNWIDASFKTFCTPLRLPYPVEIQAGTRIRQEIEFRLTGSNGRKFSFGDTRGPSVAVRTGEIKVPLPPIGLGWSGSFIDLSIKAVDRLAGLNLQHLRVDVRSSNAESLVKVALARVDSEPLDAVVELAIHFDDPQDLPAATYLPIVDATLRRHVEKIGRVLVFGGPNDDSSPPALLAAVRSALREWNVPIGAGTNADLYQLNLQRPPADADFICWSMNPQVHAFDCTSIAETPQAAAQQVASVRDYFPGKPLVVSPITLKPRFNPVATGPEKAHRTGELPPDVDPRQLSLFGAAWTLAMIKALAEARVDSMTLFEAGGWRGVLEGETGSTCPEKFPSIPDTVFPLYHVLADIGEFAHGEVILTETSDALAVTSLLVEKQRRRRLMLGNLSRDAQTISLADFGKPSSARMLDPGNVRFAVTAPEKYRNQTQTFTGTELKLKPHAVATIDFPTQ